MVGTFHAYSAKWLPNAIATGLGARRVFNKLSARIAVSDAARWTGERYFGGHYQVVPNGVDLDMAPVGPKRDSAELRIVFVGREEERKGLPVLLSAFTGLRRHIPVRLDVVGAPAEGVEPLLAEVEGGMDHIHTHGRVTDEELWRHLHEADVLCAPSLGGESFGMVLTEAFAAGTPVVASDIAGYRQVVTHGREGLLVPHGRPLELAEALRSLWLEPERRTAMASAARERAEDFAWPRVAAQVEEVYHQAIEAPQPQDHARARHRARRRAAGRHVAAPSGPAAAVAGAGAAARRSRPAQALAFARRAALGLSAVLGVAPGPARAAPRRRRERLHDARALEPGMGPDRARPVLDFHGAARGVLVLHRPRGAARPAGETPHDHERHRDRGADVRDAAGTPR